MHVARDPVNATVELARWSSGMKFQLGSPRETSTRKQRDENKQMQQLQKLWSSQSTQGLVLESQSVPGHTVALHMPGEPPEAWLHKPLADVAA